MLTATAIETAANADDRRAHRVNLMLVIVTVLSAADLVVTLGHMATVGMVEVNPIVLRLARWTHPGLAIGAFKIATVVFAVGLLHGLRRSLLAEIGTAFAVVVLASVIVQWVGYSAEMNSLDPDAFVQLAATDPGWVALR